ncbi:hypothetical protein BGZ76_003744 [Entomortierella beljakovae]|nr:hypothetical protein BGZ76_003744 [Entomortierella beljakovae]
MSAVSAGSSTRKKPPGEHREHPGNFGPSPTSNTHSGYDSRQPHPQHLHPHPQAMQQQQQQQHLQHPHGRHPDQEPIHDIETIPGYHKQVQGPPGPGPHGYYEHEIHGLNHGSGRPAMYNSQASAAQERLAASYQQYHAGGPSHDQPYRSYPGGGVSASKEDHARSGHGGHGGRGSMGHLPPDHPAQRQHSQQHQQLEYRHGSNSFHPQHQQQYPPQQKVVHVQEHPHSQYPPHHNNSTKTSSPRHGQPTGGHPGEQHDPSYRHQIPHSQGHGHGHSGSSW